MLWKSKRWMLCSTFIRWVNFFLVVVRLLLMMILTVIDLYVTDLLVWVLENSKILWCKKLSRGLQFPATPFQLTTESWIRLNFILIMFNSHHLFSSVILHWAKPLGGIIIRVEILCFLVVFIFETASREIFENLFLKFLPVHHWVSINISHFMSVFYWWSISLPHPWHGNSTLLRHCHPFQFSRIYFISIFIIFRFPKKK